MLSVYAAGIEAVIQGCAIVVAHNLSTVQLSPNTGYVEEVNSFPHHRHQPIRVTESAQPPLPEVMAEIEAHVLGIP